METSHRVEVADDEERNGNNVWHLTYVEGISNEVKPLSSHGSSVSSSSSYSSRGLANVLDDVDDDDDDDDNDDDDVDDAKPLQHSGLKPPPSPFRVSFVNSSTELFLENQMPAGYIPNRIPSSVFSGRPTTPMEWSTTSNESLFSIQVGNNSFSRDQFCSFYKSGELTKLDEQIMAQDNSQLPSVNELDQEMDMDSKDENINKVSETTAMVVEVNEVGEDHSNQKMPPAAEVHNYPIVSSLTLGDFSGIAGNISQGKKFRKNLHISPNHSISHLSDESSNSFVFPVLSETDGAGRLSSVNYDEHQNNKGGFQTHSKKHHHHHQHHHQELKKQQEEQKESMEELQQPQSPLTPKNASSRSWFSLFFCCRCL